MRVVDKILFKHYVKKLFKLFVPVIFIFTYWLFTHDDITSGEKNLYNNIPNIKVYGEDKQLNDSLTLYSRTPSIISEHNNFTINVKSKQILDYYSEELSKNGWKSYGYIEEKDKNNAYIADKFFFTNGGYRIAIRFKPPVEKIYTETDIKLFAPQYSIYMGKADVVK